VSMSNGDIFLLCLSKLYIDICIERIMLYQELSRLFCSLMVFNQKALKFHWYVTGVDFYQYHLLFQRIYEDGEGFIDRLAEHIRGVGRVPADYSVFLKLSSIKESLEVNSIDMSNELLSDVNALKELIGVAAGAAGSKQGTLNLLGDLDEALDVMFYLLSSTKTGFNI